MNRLLHTTALVFLAYSGFAAASEQRVALVIGNGAYEHGNPLKNPAADAEDVSAALKQCGFSLVGGEAQLDLSHEAFEKAVVDFREAASEAEVALFFFAGHGLEVGGTNYLVPTDSKVEEEYQVKHRTVSLDEIMGAMAGNKDRLKIIILDCCRDNPLGRGWSRSGSQGLSAVTDTPDGTVILFSAGPGRVAADGQGRNSPFSAVLKEEILSPGTELEGLFKRVGSEVYSRTGSQRPWMNSNLYESFVFLEGESTPSSMSLREETAPSLSGDFEREPAGAEYWNRVEEAINEIYELDTRGNSSGALSKVKELLKEENRSARVYFAWEYVTQEMDRRERETYDSSVAKIRSRVSALYSYQGENDETLFLVAGWLTDALINQENLSEGETMNLKQMAIDSTRKAIELNPDIAAYHYRLGNIYFLTDGANMAAKRAFERTIQLNPNHWNAWGDLVTCYLSYDENNYPASIDPEGLQLLTEFEHRSRPRFDQFYYTVTTLLSEKTAATLEPIVRKRLEHSPEDKHVAALLEEVLEFSQSNR